MSLPPDLLVVLPVFSEQACIRKVVLEWFHEIEDWTEDFVFLVINDGSTDDTAKVLERLQARLGPRLEILTRTNHGHGQTCLHGYRIAIERQIPFVFQIDSDGQCDPQYFFRFWRLREKFDVIYGNRVRRDDGWRRMLASWVLKWTLIFAAGVKCVDANVPYRLMRTSILPEFVSRIGSDFALSNIALAVLLKKSAGIRHHAIPIRFRERYGGEPSVPLNKFGAKAWELVQQLRNLH